METTVPYAHMPQIILGIETSCDETAVALVRDNGAAAPEVLSQLVYSQLDEHRLYGGVVPEIAARVHMDKLPLMVQTAVREADISWPDISAVAATGGPGLIGGVIVGTMFAKGLACALDRPYLAVNHLEAHALSARLDPGVTFPYLLLLVSGGHTMLARVDGVGVYHVLGETVDDAAGEAFDKSAKALGLPYPGGPALEQLAKNGHADRYSLPRPFVGKPHARFSFSGLKTALARQAAQLNAADTQGRADLAAGVQAAIAASLADRCRYALQSNPRLTTLVAAGGVAANAAVRGALNATADAHGARLVVPPVPLCTDNGAMIAWAGAERHRYGANDGFDFAPQPRWPLGTLSAP